MRIVHIGRTEAGGGQSSVYRLHRGLRKFGHDSMFFVAARYLPDDDPNIQVFAPPADLLSRLHRRFSRAWITWDRARGRRARPAGAEFFTDDRSPAGAQVLQQIPPCDVVNIHTMHGLIDYRAVLPALARRVPIVKSLHDMAFFTGGCHVDAGCGRFVGRCGACPQLGSTRPDDASRHTWWRKHSALSAIATDRLCLVSPSRWLADEAIRSSLAGRFAITVIPHGVDTEVFQPRDKDLARDVLGVPPATRVVLFVAEGLQRPVKGFEVLAQALNGLAKSDDLMLISVGGGKPTVEVQIPHLALGSIHNERFLSLVYSAADVLAAPSLQEAFGLAVLEAMACGVPVIGSAVGGIRELVRQGITGHLVPSRDPDALRAAICQLVDDPAERAAMGSACRQTVVEEFSLTLQIRRYVELYEAIRVGRVPGLTTFNGDGLGTGLNVRDQPETLSRRVPRC